MKSKIIIVVAVLVGITLGVGSMQLLRTSSQASRPCNVPSNTAESHNIMIMNGKAEPGSIAGKLCDSLTITNMDTVAREISFGPHDQHVPYDGVAERVLNAGQSFTITLNQTGSFHLHDHLHEEIQAYFTVAK